MEEFVQFVLGGLGLDDCEVLRDARTDAGIIDLVLQRPGEAFLIEYKARSPGPDAIARLSLYVNHPGLLKDTRIRGEPHGVLVAPAFSQKVRHLAHETGIRLLHAPLDLIPRSPDGGVLLTTEKAWAVVTAALRMRGFTIRDLAKEAGASTGWTSSVVRTLSAMGLFTSTGAWTEDAIPRILDRVASERPLKRLERTRIQTGIEGWDEFQETMQAQWNDIAWKLDPPGLWACGQSAAMTHTDYILRHDRFQVYSNDLQGLKGFFRHEHDGIEIVVYEPDRNVGASAATHGPWPTVSLEQALLDVAGMGYAARDTAAKLVEALRA